MSPWWQKDAAKCRWQSNVADAVPVATAVNLFQSGIESQIEQGEGGKEKGESETEW